MKREFRHALLFSLMIMAGIVAQEIATRISTADDHPREQATVVPNFRKTAGAYYRVRRLMIAKTDPADPAEATGAVAVNSYADGRRDGGSYRGTPFHPTAMLAALQEAPSPTVPKPTVANQAPMAVPSIPVPNPPVDQGHPIFLSQVSPRSKSDPRDGSIYDAGPAHDTSSQTSPDVDVHRANVDPPHSTSIADLDGHRSDVDRPDPETAVAQAMDPVTLVAEVNLANGVRSESEPEPKSEIRIIPNSGQTESDGSRTDESAEAVESFAQRNERYDDSADPAAAGIDIHEAGDVKQHSPDFPAFTQQDLTQQTFKQQPPFAEGQTSNDATMDDPPRMPASVDDPFFVRHSAPRIDPREAVHRRAAMKAAGRSQRIEANKWAGYSPLRPPASVNPFMESLPPVAYRHIVVPIVIRESAEDDDSSRVLKLRR